MADEAYDNGRLRALLPENGTRPVIPSNPTLKRHHPFDVAIAALLLRGWC